MSHRSGRFFIITDKDAQQDVLIASLQNGGGGGSSGSVSYYTHIIDNIPATSSNVIGPTTVPAWTVTFTTGGNQQAFWVSFTALTGEMGLGPRTYQLLIDGTIWAQRTIFHNDGSYHYNVSMTCFGALGAGLHTCSIHLPENAAVNDGDYCDILMHDFNAGVLLPF